ncbi:LAMI_0G06744g1_1 [Lachancea mirantina]|uniref:LAMI_0G06744g1_1 n=1 Tax=Lachancea mirantina TaxID=1230905 RepID=A0A1G4K999_9SACH|nr:LAMI_0G06744g1_1 [Lachancea mirantina]
MSVNITTDIARVTSTLAIAFAHSAENDYLTKKFWNMPASQTLSRSEINKSFVEYCEYFVANGGQLLESGDFDSVAIIVPPESNPVDLEETNDEKFNAQFIHTNEKIKQDLGLGVRIPYYYLFMIGKNLDQPHVKGNVRAIVEYLKLEADKKGAAVVLDALNGHAKSVYEYFGFLDYHEFRYGVGEVEANGELSETGPGFVANIMAYYKDGDLRRMIAKS